MSDTPGALRIPAPRLGEHTDEILARLGISAGEIARLHAAGVIK
jgi:crotonobetainyl-CoA:carnitine CoA-transferase CaiB-like acyl-CoA transferase